MNISGRKPKRDRKEIIKQVLDHLIETGTKHNSSMISKEFQIEKTDAIKLLNALVNKQLISAEEEKNSSKKISGRKIKVYFVKKAA